MSQTRSIPGWKDKVLFTPGPLTTSRTVKQAMLRDLGSRDTEFIAMVKEIRQRLVALGGGTEPEYTTVLMQGSGTFGVEAVISSTIPPEGKLLALINGAYGSRIARIAATLKIDLTCLTYPEIQTPDLDELEKTLAGDAAITHVALVHSETTTGIVNPVREIGQIVRRHGRVFMVDAMSSFGAYPIDLKDWGIDYLVSSANKCIEGVPGFSFILARREALEASRGSARSLSLDLHAQLEGLEKDGQFRFTPPTHALLAFRQALDELDQEGGIAARAARYCANYQTTLAGLQALGFKPYLPRETQGYIITSFYYPDHPNFNFRTFYERLSEKGFVIYPGKLSHADCFRIGHVGRIDQADVNGLIAAVGQTLAEMNVTLG
jgi:2-aminoethylphosphonate-pyruvate transaminase